MYTNIRRADMPPKRRKEYLMARFKKIICFALAAVMALGTLCACSSIDDTDPQTATTTSESVTDTPATDVTSQTDTPAETQPIAEPENWSYDFGWEFISENGLQYIWDRLDEDTRMNLGEVMNAIRDVQMYCPLTVGVPRDEAEKFLELVSNCSMFYTYASNSFGLHTDENGIVKGVTLNYLVNYESEAAQRCEELEAKLQEIIASAPTDNEFDRIRYLHDYLVLNCDYGEDAISPFSAYGAIVEGIATCQGYADGMHLLLTRAGFETAYAIGQGTDTDVKHKWNYVKCEDGHWYVIDPTWDDPENKDDPDYIGYDYLLVSDDMLLKDHATKFDSDYYGVPVADSMDMNFHIMVGYYTDDPDEAYEILLNQAIEAARDGRIYLYLRSSTGDAIDNIYTELTSGTAGDNKIQDIIKQANEAAGTNYDSTSWLKSLNTNIGTLTLTLKDAE